MFAGVLTQGASTNCPKSKSKLTHQVEIKFAIYLVVSNILFCCGLYELYPRKRNQEVLKHLSHLIEMCDGDFCFVVWDNASQHTTPMLWPFLLENSHRLCTVGLPTYSPHLNKIEKLWWYMRQQITRNHFYQTFDALLQALVGWLQRLELSRFCSLMGLPTGQPLAA